MDSIIIEKNGHIAIIRINRPKVMNSLNKKVLLDLEEAILSLEVDKKILVLIITGIGKAFVAGADISKMLNMTTSEAREFSTIGHRVLNMIINSRLIAIAAINGYALGGGNELTLACDIRISSRKAIFSQPEVGLGIIAGFGGTQRLAMLVGEGRARELLYTGKTIEAEEALKIGLVNFVVSEEKLLDKAVDLALEISRNSPLALKKTKEAINYGLYNRFQDGLEREIKLFSECFATNDQKEGMKAFLEKREARFQGK
ncbi:MAG: enoyl-CoA hydratase-related protein [Halanaerobiales bacterium]